ncbi:hypothetical protein [Pedobacter sp.]|uniref:hypothetical protein n=1 Tax=Pedobacter sp. TaxID=1411316 RepID=UPI003D7F9CA8
MNNIELTELSDQELLAERKKLKSNHIINAVLCGLLIGVSIYNTVRNGLGFFTFFPLYFVFIVFNNRKKTKALNDELKSRNLE